MHLDTPDANPSGANYREIFADLRTQLPPLPDEDPETRATYVLLRAEVYDDLKPPAPVREDLPDLEIPESYRRSKEAFLRDLPELMARKRLRGRWALYRGDQRIVVEVVVTTFIRIVIIIVINIIIIIIIVLFTIKFTINF